MWSYRNDEEAATRPIGGYRRLLAADQAFANATGGTAAAIGGFSFPVTAGSAWVVQLVLTTTGVSGGGKISVSGPASPAVLSIVTRGLTSGVTAYSTDQVTVLDTLSAAYNTSAVTGNVEATITIVPTLGGTVTINAANVTNSNSFVVKAGSFLIATRVS